MKIYIRNFLFLFTVVIGSLIGSANAAVTYVHTDHLGSVIAESNSSGGITKRFHYKPFGESVESQQDDIGYAAHKFDVDLGLTYMEARYYDPVLGRFYGNDPVGYTANNPVMSFNRYMYVNNNPYGYTDPDGEILNFIGKFVLDVGVNVAIQVVSGQEINLKEAVVDSAKGALDPSKTLRNMAKLGKAVVAGGGSSNAARKEVMRQQNIPTSQQPISQSKNGSGREYRYFVTKSGGGTETKSVQQQTLDRSHPEQGHWEAGSVKTDPFTREIRMNDYGRPKLTNDKSKVDYDD